MNLEQAKIILDKINRLFNNINADPGAVSSIEKDLMVKYIQEFYEQINITAPKQKQKVNPPVEKIAVEPYIEPVIEAPIQEVKPVIPTEQLKEEAQEKANAMRNKVEENARKAANIMKTQGMYVSDNPQPKESKPIQPAAVQESIQPVVQKPIEEIPVVSSSASFSDQDDVEALFAFKRAKELSEKLSELPIKDLSTALGLNEKIFTINELFGGKKEAYERSVQAINEMSNFEEAKSYLIENVVSTYNWTNNEKKKKAKIFIKLVRRRFG